MITYHDGNIFDSDAKIICHQVSVYGAMGAELAAEVKERFPEVYEEYNACCLTYSQDELFGEVLCSSIKKYSEVIGDGLFSVPKRFIANCFSQKGMDTDYELFTSAMGLVRKWAEKHNNAKIAIPYKMGCGTAGGDWNTVEQIIHDVFDGSDLEVEIWKLV